MSKLAHSCDETMAIIDQLAVDEPNEDSLFFHAHAKDECDHKWDGPVIEIERGASATCSKCGMDAFSHSMRNGW